MEPKLSQDDFFIKTEEDMEIVDQM
jgi:hypothetical protein